MPRLTSRVFTDLAIWMAGFGLLIGLIFPPFCLVLGLPAERVISPLFFGSTLIAGAIVGAANHALARLIVGRRLQALAAATATVESRMADGGEEFLVILPGAGPADVIQVGERIRRAIGETVVMDGDQRVTISVSLGGTTYRETGVESPEALLAQPDEALYLAKRAGRDRLVMWRGGEVAA